MFSLDFLSGNKTVFFSILICFVFLFNARTQNLVPNGSFEEYYSCPTANDLNDGQFELCKYWWKPTMGTSDYFNRCNNGSVGVPNNFWGYQEPYDGDGYVGLGLIGWYLSSGNYLGNEYAQAKLIRPLKPCVEYHFEMKVNLANYSRYAFGRIGALFTNSSIHLNSDSAITSSPQIFNQEGIISDTAQWTAVSGNFIALGNEQYITIGYFFNNVKNDTMSFQEPIGFDDQGYGYYYIDDVILIEVGVIEQCEYSIPNVITANNDGVNDAIDFSVFNKGSVSIYNRWGNVVFTNENDTIWNGTDLLGQKLVDGVYFYIVKGQKDKNGFIHLIR